MVNLDNLESLNPPPTATSTATTCAGATSKGLRCQRPVRVGMTHCWQHSHGLKQRWRLSLLFWRSTGNGIRVNTVDAQILQLKLPLP